jgi:sortase A
MPTEAGRREAEDSLPSRVRRDAHWTIRWAERFLWSAGGAALAFCGLYLGTGFYQQLRGERELARLTSSGAPPSAPLHTGDVVGRIVVPRLGLSTVIFEGTDDSVLVKGAGHLAGSALPGGKGNVVLAAHRDTFFRALKNVRTGDLVILDVPGGEFRYSVSATSVVSPEAVDVTRPTKAPALTLLTCYPFDFFGHAPDRFVVRADLSARQ